MIETEDTASPKTPKQWHKRTIDVGTGPDFLCHCLTVLGQAVLFKRWKQKTLLLRGLQSSGTKEPLMLALDLISCATA